jgi:GNAT superfamily N-acetyltransferase
MSDLVLLFCAMLDHYEYRFGENVASISAFLSDHLFGPAPTVFCQVALDDNETLLGFATYTFVIPGVGLGRELFVKELYMSEAARGKGAGKALMVALSALAADNDCSRMRWITGRGDDYQAARGLYASIGGRVMDQAMVYSMDRSAIDRLNGQNDNGG